MALAGTRAEVVVVKWLGHRAGDYIGEVVVNCGWLGLITILAWSLFWSSSLVVVKWLGPRAGDAAHLVAQLSFYLRCGASAMQRALHCMTDQRFSPPRPGLGWVGSDYGSYRCIAALPKPIPCTTAVTHITVRRYLNFSKATTGSWCKEVLNICVLCLFVTNRSSLRYYPLAATQPFEFWAHATMHTQARY